MSSFLDHYDGHQENLLSNQTVNNFGKSSNG
jgi:hypothetical protein